MKTLNVFESVNAKCPVLRHLVNTAAGQCKSLAIQLTPYNREALKECFGEIFNEPPEVDYVYLEPMPGPTIGFYSRFTANVYRACDDFDTNRNSSLNRISIPIKDNPDYSNLYMGFGELSLSTDLVSGLVYPFITNRLLTYHGEQLMNLIEDEVSVKLDNRITAFSLTRVVIDGNKLYLLSLYRDCLKPEKILLDVMLGKLRLAGSWHKIPADIPDDSPLAYSARDKSGNVVIKYATNSAYSIQLNVLLAYSPDYSLPEKVVLLNGSEICRNTVLSLRLRYASCGVAPEKDKLYLWDGKNKRLSLIVDDLSSTVPLETIRLIPIPLPLLA